MALGIVAWRHPSSDKQCFLRASVRSWKVALFGFWILCPPLWFAGESLIFWADSWPPGPSRGLTLNSELVRYCGADAPSLLDDQVRYVSNCLLAKIPAL